MIKERDKKGGIIMSKKELFEIGFEVATNVTVKAFSGALKGENPLQIVCDELPKQLNERLTEIAAKSH